MIDLLFLCGEQSGGDLEKSSFKSFEEKIDFMEGF